MPSTRRTLPTIRIHLALLLEQRGLSMRAFSKQSGICYPSVHGLCHERARRIDTDTLARICSTLGVEPGDVLKAER